MLQMRQSMPNDLPCLRKYQVHPVHLSEMWVDCYPSEDTYEGETMTRTTIHGGEVDLLCECGTPQYRTSSLKYGFRITVWCNDCEMLFAMDVIE